MLLFGLLYMYLQCELTITVKQTVEEPSLVLASVRVYVSSIPCYAIGADVARVVYSCAVARSYCGLLSDLAFPVHQPFFETGHKRKVAPI